MIKSQRTGSPFIEDVLDSLRRRSKALKHKNATPAIERFVETLEGVSEERVEITIKPRKRQRLTLTVWEDRGVRVSAHESISQAGWKFSLIRSGRFLGINGGQDVVWALEEMLSTMFEMTSDDIDRLDAIWGPILARGPQTL